MNNVGRESNQLGFTGRKNLVGDSTWCGMNHGYVIDVTTMTLSDNVVQSKCEMMSNGQYPTLLIGVSMCAESGALNVSLNSIQFVIKLYETQHSEGRYFVHAHSDDAKSWRGEFVKKLSGEEKVTVNMDGIAKPTTPMIVKRLSGWQRGRQVRPKEACSTGLQDQLRTIGRLNSKTVGFQEEPIEWTADDYENISDNITGKTLSPEAVQIARREELGSMGELAVSKEVSFEQCRSETNAKPNGTKWIDIKKGDGDRVEIRSRLVASHFGSSHCGSSYESGCETWCGWSVWRGSDASVCSKEEQAPQTFVTQPPVDTIT